MDYARKRHVFAKMNMKNLYISYFLSNFARCYYINMCLDASVYFDVHIIKTLVKLLGWCAFSIFYAIIDKWR